MSVNTAEDPVELRRWWQVLGPWPLQPLGAGVATWMFTVAVTLGWLAPAPLESSARAVFQVAFLAPIPGIAVMVVLYLLKRYWPVCQVQGWAYCVAMLAGATAILIAREFIRLAPLRGVIPGPGPYPILGGMLRALVLLVVIHALWGGVGRRLSAIAEQRREAMERAQEQQELLLSADERIRGQISSLLHDRVQAGLVAACLELREASADSSPEGAMSISRVIDRLESMRTVDVRPAARALSPDLTDSDLQLALEELAAQYSPGMSVGIRINPQLVRIDTRPDPEILLACYRVVEQALLNSAVHGRAQHCTVVIECTPHAIDVTVDDDGTGMKPNPVSGVGTALTTTRMRMLHGTWSRENRSAGGVRVSAHIPR